MLGLIIPKVPHLLPRTHFGPPYIKLADLIPDLLDWVQCRPYPRFRPNLLTETGVKWSLFGQIKTFALSSSQLQSKKPISDLPNLEKPNSTNHQKIKTWRGKKIPNSPNHQKIKTLESNCAKNARPINIPTNQPPIPRTRALEMS